MIYLIFHHDLDHRSLPRLSIGIYLGGPNRATFPILTTILRHLDIRDSFNGCIFVCCAFDMLAFLAFPGFSDKLRTDRFRILVPSHVRRRLWFAHGLRQYKSYANVYPCALCFLSIAGPTCNIRCTYRVPVTSGLAMAMSERR